MADKIRSAVTHNYPSIASNLMGPLLELLIVARGASRGDVDRLLILMVVALRTAEDESFKALTYEDVINARLPHVRGGRITAMKIAEILGASQETVRRKVVELIEQGWLQREEGRLRYTAQAFAEIAPVRAKMLEVAVAYHRLIGPLIAHEEARPDPPTREAEPQPAGRQVRRSSRWRWRRRAGVR